MAGTDRTVTIVLKRRQAYARLQLYMTVRAKWRTRLRNDYIVFNIVEIIYHDWRKQIL